MQPSDGDLAGSASEPRVNLVAVPEKLTVSCGGVVLNWLLVNSWRGLEIGPFASAVIWMLFKVITVPCALCAMLDWLLSGDVFHWQLDVSAVFPKVFC